MTELQVLDGMYRHEHQAKLKTFSIDIETFTQGKRANEYTDAKDYKLGNVKDPDKVKVALMKKKEEARRKHALSWWTGKVISVAVVDVFGDDEPLCFYGHDEKVILEQLATCLNRPCNIIGKSNDMFDNYFLIGRYMLHKLDIPKVLKPQFRSRQFDVDKFFGYSAQSSQRGSLNDYAHGLGIETKTMKGSDVHDLYSQIMISDEKEANRLWKELVDYNIHDSEIVAEMARRFAGSDRRL